MKPARRFKIYAKLLYLYPPNYRRQYGQQLLQTIADMVDDAPSAGARFAVWLRISFDLPITICKEHFLTIGENMYTKQNLHTNRNAVIGGALLLLPVALLAINRSLMLSGPGRGIPTYLLIKSTTILPALAVMLSGFTLYRLLRSDRKVQANHLRQACVLAIVCVLSLAFFIVMVWDITGPHH